MSDEVLFEGHRKLIFCKEIWVWDLLDSFGGMFWI